MPLSRYQIRNVYSFADPELYKAADKDDPEALLEGVAMAGVVGVIRQLGDLAEFAAEIFHELHEEVAATAARSHGLLVRAQQLEVEIPSIERSFLSQKCHSTFSPNSGIDWHPNMKTTHNLITTGDLPRSVMDSYEDCRGPPRLFLLDKFDVGGEGVCLKRYTDPSFYKVEVSSYDIENAEIQREKKIRKNKKKISPWKRGGTPEVSPNSKAKLHQLFLEDRMQNGTTEPTHHVKLKKRPNKSPFDNMSKFLNSQSEGKIVHPVPFYPSIIPVPSDSPNQPGIEKFMDAMGSPFDLGTQSRSPSVSSTGSRNPADNLAGKVPDLTTSTSPKINEKKIAVDEEIGTHGVQNGYRSDDVASEMDNYVDALATLESEVDANQGVVLEEGSEGNENLKKEQHQIDCISPAGSRLSFQLFRNYEGEVENEHPNDGSSPIVHLPNILEVNKDNHSTTSVHRQCSSPHLGISHSVVEETLDGCEICCLPEEKLRGGDDILHDSDSPEAEVADFSENGTESKNSGIGIVTRAVSDLDDADKSGGNYCSVVIMMIIIIITNIIVIIIESEIRERDTGLVNSEIEVERKDDNALSTHEDDRKSEGKGEEDCVDSEEMAKTAAVDKIEDNNTHSTSVELCITQENNQIHYFLEENNQIGQQASVSHDFESKSMKHGDVVDIASGTHVDHQTDSDTHSVNPASESIPDKQPTLELLKINGQDIDQVKHQFHSDLSSINLAGKSEEDPQLESMTPSVSQSVSVKPPSLELPQPTSHDIDPFDQVKHQFHSDFYLVNLACQIPLPETPPQTTSHNIDHSHKVKHQLPPMFPGFITPPVKIADTPPLPPLPPMQWRMKKSPLSSPTDGGQHNFPPVFQSKPDAIKNPETGNEKFKHEDSLHTEDRDKLETEFAENLVPQQTTNSYSVHQGDEMLTNIQSMKSQRPRNPLIDAVATHDKTKLRKVSDRVMSQITKGQENAKLLEQIRTKSYKLKPAVQTRPNIHSPNTNVRLAAILEKANAIRQVVLGEIIMLNRYNGEITFLPFTKDKSLLAM
ncbi:hypothetical protein LXL04_019229 [Taraxacum kok-saghyz]